MIVRRHPEWIKVRPPAGPATARTAEVLAANRLETVCREAQCPNQGECWSLGTATFMLLGDTCTRGCRFCAVGKGKPAAPDPEEPLRVALAARELGLRHVVLTSVNRDDLPGQGSGHFAATILALREGCPKATIETLVPDFQGDPECIDRVLDAAPDVLNHNLETVPRLYRTVRPGAEVTRSLALLARSASRAGLRVKTGLMLGLGEREEEVLELLQATRAAGCHILTLGQYLRPSPAQLPVVRYLHPEEFHRWRELALALGFIHVESGPLVRSSYHAAAHGGAA